MFFLALEMVSKHAQKHLATPWQPFAWSKDLLNSKFYMWYKHLNPIENLFSQQNSCL